MQPAQSIIAKLGGPTKVATRLGCHRTRVSNWMRPRAKGGTGGIIPHWRIGALLEFAKEQGEELTPSDFAPLPIPSREGRAGA